MARMVLAALVGAMSLVSVAPAAATPVASGGPVDLSSEYDLRLDGAFNGERTGVSVARAGDVDGDGRGDVIVGSEVASYNGRSNAGAAWVAFGQPSKTVIDLSESGRGFRIEGPEPQARAGFAVSGAGDVNGDGKADVIVGAKGATFGASNAPAPPGAAYVVFGSSSTSPVDLANLGSRGFRIRNVTPSTVLQLGTSVAGGGDVNGDGLSDVVVGAPGARMAHGNTGFAYVIFGSSSTAEVDVGALGSRGFAITGTFAPEQRANELGAGVAMLGDVDGDALADVAVGAPSCASCFTPSYVHVVRGKAATGLVDVGAAGAWGYSIRLPATGAGNRIGDVLAAAGDVSGDGRPDVVIGNQTGFLTTSQREAYVVFGRAATGDTIDAGGTGSGFGFTILGPSGVENAFAGAVGGGGDVNGDGKADVVVGDRFADPLGRTNAGSSYVVFGKSDSATVSALTLGAGGVRIDGASANDESGGSVAGAGNVAGDAKADVVVGAPAADERGRTLAGAAYVVAGAALTPPAPDCLATNLLTGTDSGETLNGSSGADRIELRGGNDYSDGLGSDDCLYGELGEDHLFGGSGLDLIDGGPGQDEIKGGTSADTIYGGSGADYYLAGEDGSDTIYPGPDNDSTYGGTGNDKVFDETGEDFIYGEAGGDTLRGGAGNDYINGGADNDKLYGEADDDRLYGDDGNDELYGGAGLDLLYGQNGADTISGEADNDEAYAGPGPDVVRGGDGNDRIFGQEDDDQLYGDQLDDVIEGEGGNDTIDGNTGNDTIKGGSGTDTLKGTAGNDAIDAADGEADSVDCGSGTDTAIVDAIDTVVGCETRTVAGFASARVACPASAVGACTGVATYRATGTRATLGTARYAVTPGRTATIVFSVRHAGAMVKRATVLLTARKRSTPARVASATLVRKVTSRRR